MSFGKSMQEYKQQMERGILQQAYRGLMEYMLGLRKFFAERHPDCFISNSLYFGYMDMTYFAFIPPALKERDLKIAIVFLHDTCSFEAWLAGANRQVQAKIWELIQQSAWSKYPLVPSIQGQDAILRHVLAANPDFDNVDALTAQIEQGTLELSQEVERFFAGLAR